MEICWLLVDAERIGSHLGCWLVWWIAQNRGRKREVVPPVKSYFWHNYAWTCAFSSLYNGSIYESKVLWYIYKICHQLSNVLPLISTVCLHRGHEFSMRKPIDWNSVMWLYIYLSRMTAYFNKVGWPDKVPKGEQERKEFVASLHKRKTELFMALIEKKLLPLRPGVAK